MKTQMTLSQALKLMGMSLKDVDDAPYLEVFGMLADVGFDVVLADRKTGKVVAVLCEARV